MRWRSLTAAVLVASALGLTHCPAAEKSAEPASGKAAPSSIKYLPLDAPEGMSQAVIVQGFSLVHTRQLLPLDAAGKLVGEGSADKQIEQTLTNLETVLKDSGSGLDKLVRLNVYALAPTTVPPDCSPSGWPLRASSDHLRSDPAHRRAVPLRGCGKSGPARP